MSKDQKKFIAVFAFAIFLMIYLLYIYRSSTVWKPRGIFGFNSYYTRLTEIKENAYQSVENQETFKVIYPQDDLTKRHPDQSSGKLGYLVYSEHCIIPDFDPYQYEIMKNFTPIKYQPCSLLKPLTRVVYNAKKKQYTLKVIRSRIKLYSNSWLKCCYQSAKRFPHNDYNVELSNPVYFAKQAHLAPTIDFILVKCRSKGMNVYTNGHAMMPERHELRKRINKWKSKDIENQQNATSVIMIGIDSLSRINLKRAMPKLAKYLYGSDWFELSGYNKIDDNTFPNLMGILTGFNLTTVHRKCLQGTKHLDNCTSIIWNTFRDHGYVTAYGEDEAWINTFNLKTKGFRHPPVDYYLRPYFLLANMKLKIKKRGNLHRCIGYQDSADVIFDYAEELVTRFRNVPYFGLFWMSSFTHQTLNGPTAMNEHITKSLRKFMALDGLNNTIVLFFSDHGLRYGPIHKTLQGYYETRLPFMFIWLPPKLRQSHPEFVNALSVNRNRLTCPYDLHMTLKHVLALSKRVADKECLAPAEDCPRCQTLLAPVPHNRSCDDVAIDYHWCTCFPYQRVNIFTETLYQLVNKSIDHMNQMLRNFQNGAYDLRCARLSLSHIDSAYSAPFMGNNSDELYRFSFNTIPNNGMFSATVRCNKFSGHFKFVGQISRLDSYNKDARCMRGDPYEKRFCSCI